MSVGDLPVAQADETGRAPGEPSSSVDGAGPKTGFSSEAIAAQKTTKREDYISWDDYFMSIAFLSAMRSKDPSRQVGACIVDPSHKIVGIGYNGFPLGCSDEALPWARQAERPEDTKYPYVCHAEMNAIINKNSADLRGCRIYSSLFPCNECAKLIIQSGVREVVYMREYHDAMAMRTSRRLLSMANVAVRQFTPSRAKVLIDFCSVG